MHLKEELEGNADNPVLLSIETFGLHSLHGALKTNPGKKLEFGNVFQKSL